MLFYRILYSFVLLLMPGSLHTKVIPRDVYCDILEDSFCGSCIGCLLSSDTSNVKGFFLAPEWLDKAIIHTHRAKTRCQPYFLATLCSWRNWNLDQNNSKKMQMKNRLPLGPSFFKSQAPINWMHECRLFGMQMVMGRTDMWSDL